MQKTEKILNSISENKPNTFFQTKVRIHFHEADPAGILYFANVFSLAHQVFEEFIPATGILWSDWFTQPKIFIPIRHAECDFQSPFFPGQEYQVQVQILTISKCSFKIQYHFFQQTNATVKTNAIATMVHAFVDPKTKVKTQIPKNILDHLSLFYSEKI